jgi:hypothetical protein
MSPVIKAIVAVLIISIGHLIVAVYYLLVYSGKRTKRFRQEAEAMGLSFTPSMDIESLDAVGHFDLFSKGKTQQVSNVMRGKVDGVDVMMFDYRHFTRGVPGSARRYTVVFFHSDRLNLPPFILGPKNMGHYLGKKLCVSEDMAVAENPAFTRRYFLRSPYGQDLRAHFSDEIFISYSKNRGLTTEGENDRLLLYRSRYVAPAKIRSFMDQAIKVFELFSF